MTKHRKPKAERKETFIRIRVSAAQRTKLHAAAEKAGLDLSGWLRLISLKAAS
jgi:uncharacterized protein (DUF1778 family)